MSTKIKLHQKIHNCRKILILGEPGSGKNYLGEKIAVHLGLPFKDVDDIIWKRKFDIRRHRELRKKMVEAETKKEKWVFVGIPATWAQHSVDKAQVIIILRERILIEIIRIFVRFVKRNYFAKKPKETLKSVLELIKWNYQKFHKKDGDKRILIEKIARKNVSKTYILQSRHEVNLLLEMLLK